MGWGNGVGVKGKQRGEERCAHWFPAVGWKDGRDGVIGVSRSEPQPQALPYLVPLKLNSLMQNAIKLKIQLANGR